MGSFTVLHYVGSEEDRGGILTMVRALVGAGLGRGVVWVAPEFRATRAPALRWLRKSGPPAETINVRAAWSAAGVAWRLRRALGRGRRIFHGHSRAGLLVGLWLKLLGADRVVVSVHCHGRQRWFYRWAALVLGGRLVWLTPAMKRHYDVGGGNWRGCQRNFLREKENPGSQSEPKSNRWIGDNPLYLRLGGIGAIVAWKGWHLVIEALAKLSGAERERVKFLHVGSADNRPESRAYALELRTRSEALGVSANITWRGEETSSEALLASVDVLVVPSFGEPFSLALLEAWRAGVPVLAADDGGPAELIAEGRDGWCFASGSSSALAEKISELLRPETWEKIRPELPAAEAVLAGWRGIYAEALA